MSAAGKLAGVVIPSQDHEPSLGHEHLEFLQELHVEALAVAGSGQAVEALVIDVGLVGQVESGQ